MLNRIHHIAIICSDYVKSKQFYTEILGLQVIREQYRADKHSWKLDLALNGQYIIELFSFQNPPKRLSWPEACGLRHLAFEVDNLTEVLNGLKDKHIEAEPIRFDEATNKTFSFIFDPDQLPIELYEY
ncbi:SMU1112c/YaeR family gloxylase I-like metalloprotein [Legionella jordanis]|uniref:Putative lyase n=1 Tax=Legionella jordanis TaxID=456 RepID=A0A0W0VDY6_9GAMM|nr:VOC family protein [Legionella jordanis]KTD17849.1 putative lyase [Legionella jordanis]VEH11214.1 putative lyase [Legionella jordanis]